MTGTSGRTMRGVLLNHAFRVIDWISEGGAEGVKSAKMRNDIVDINYAAYATFFDGLLSADKKAQRMYQGAHALIRGIFQDE